MRRRSSVVTQGQTPPGDEAAHLRIAEPSSGSASQASREPVSNQPLSAPSPASAPAAGSPPQPTGGAAAEPTGGPAAAPTEGPAAEPTEGSAAARTGGLAVGPTGGPAAEPSAGLPEAPPSGPPAETLEQEGEIAADYLEGLLDIADLDGDIDMDVEGGRAAVSIVGVQLGHLVGRDGEVLEALQELTRLAVMRVTGERSRLMLDVGGYRAARRRELTDVGQRAAADAKSSGEPVKLPPMTPFERKIVHDAVAAAGLRSESEGEEPGRYVVVFPA
jgi:spoIIIJ-associated protein